MNFIKILPLLFITIVTSWSQSSTEKLEDHGSILRSYYKEFLEMAPIWLKENDEIQKTTNLEKDASSFLRILKNRYNAEADLHNTNFGVNKIEKMPALAKDTVFHLLVQLDETMVDFEDVDQVSGVTYYTDEAKSLLKILAEPNFIEEFTFPKNSSFLALLTLQERFHTFMLETLTKIVRKNKNFEIVETDKQKKTLIKREDYFKEKITNIDNNIKDFVDKKNDKTSELMKKIDKIDLQIKDMYMQL